MNNRFSLVCFFRASAEAAVLLFAHSHFIFYSHRYSHVRHASEFRQSTKSQCAQFNSGVIVSDPPTSQQSFVFL
jgi:hypothetical protein